MTEFVLKSTLSLTFLYLMYFLLLRNMKAFQFNRFYLLFTLFFSVAIPFLHIKTSVHLPINQTIQQTSASMGDIQLQDTFVVNQNVEILNAQNILLFLYLLVFSILLIRFVFNLNRLTRIVKSSKKIQSTVPKIVLASEKTLPYSFLNYIIVNKDDYEMGNIEKGLLIHEQAHCQQYHSVDILLIEIAKLVLWFNPIVWIMKKEIQLVHEYIADNEVLQNQNVKTYQNTLLNLVFRNNSIFLASNFNYSLTKKRLLMMTKNNSSKKSMVRKIAIIPLVMILAFSLSFSQNNIPDDDISNYSNQWWYPLLKKHDIKTSAFNNFENFFVTGSSITINEGVAEIKDAVFIIKRGDNKYRILETSLAYHDMKKNIIKGDKGFIRTFNMDLQDMNQADKNIRCTSFEVQVDDKNSTWLVDMNTGHVSSK